MIFRRPELWEEPLIDSVEGNPNPISVEFIDGVPTLCTASPISEGAATNLQLVIDLLRSDVVLPRRIRGWLADMLDENASSPFQFKKLSRRKRGRYVQGRRSHIDAAEFASDLTEQSVKVEAAIMEAEQRFNLSRSTVFKAKAKYKHAKDMGD